MLIFESPEAYPSSTLAAEKGEQHLDCLTDTLLNEELLVQIPAKDRTKASHNRNALKECTRNILRNCPQLNKEQGFIGNFINDLEAMVDVHVFCERLPGFQALVQMNRQGPQRDFFPPMDSPLLIQKDKMLAKYLGMMNVVAEDMQDLFPEPITQVSKRRLPRS